LISGAFLAACALFTPTTPHWLLLLTLLTGGFFRSLEFTALNAISYADIEQPRMSRATSFASVSQQMSGAIGVAVAAICVQTIQLGFGDPELQARDLSLSFVLVAIISSLSVFVFAKLKPDAGAAVSGKLPVPQEAQPAAAE
jgi:MFS family permease